MATASVPRAMNRVGHSLLISAEPFSPAWDEDRAGDICSRLELGDIVLFSDPPVDLPARDRDVLLGRKQRGSAYHKNIAYRPSEDRVTGLDAAERAEAAEWRRILRGYSQDAVAFLSRFLLPYAGQCQLDYTSFRAVEEQGRPARLHARNDLLHVDSFPTRPTNGARILRFFTNINAARNRVWLTSQRSNRSGRNSLGWRECPVCFETRSHGVCGHSPAFCVCPAVVRLTTNSCNACTTR